MTDTNVENMNAVLGKPFSGDLPENALKIRRNLLIVSLIIMFLTFTGAAVDPESKFLGLSFSNLSVEDITSGLLILNVYLWIHFLWYAWEAIGEWRVRLTGTKVTFQTAASYADLGGDYPSDPRQSTLYNWWDTYARDIHLHDDPLKEIRNAIPYFHEQLSALKENISESDIASAKTTLTSIDSKISKLQKQFEQVSKVLGSPRINASLERFDNWFYLILRIQSLRWIIIDVSFPVLIGLIANLILACKLIYTT
jgi:hypothetical protein